MRRRALLMGGTRTESFTVSVMPTNETRFNLELFSSAGGKVDWGDGTVQNTMFSGTLQKNYSVEENRILTISVKKGLKDVKSFYFNGIWNWDFDFPSLINLFPKLESINISTYYNSSITNNGYFRMTGDLSQIPDSVITFNMTSLSTISRDLYVLNFSNFSNSSKLQRLQKAGSNAAFDNGFLYTGDLSKMPKDLNYLYFSPGSKAVFSDISYTPGRVWAAEIERISIEATRASAFPTNIIDNILIDIDNSGSVPIGDGILSFRGVRSSASDSAVINLTTKGFTVNIIAP